MGVRSAAGSFQRHILVAGLGVAFASILTVALGALELRHLVALMLGLLMAGAALAAGPWLRDLTLYIQCATTICEHRKDVCDCTGRPCKARV